MQSALTEEKKMLKLSNAGKMPCKSWSLEALDTCAGSMDQHGDLVPVCADCYAAKGMYRFPAVKALRVHNKQDWKRDEWVADMVTALQGQPYFRWFDSGDVYHIGLMRKIFQVVEDTPDTMHWLPTRMYKFKKFRTILLELAQYENVVVRWSIDQGYLALHQEHKPNMSIVIPDGVEHDLYEDNKHLTICRSRQNKGKCGDCRACWNRDVEVIAYIHH